MTTQEQPSSIDTAIKFNVDAPVYLSIALPFFILISLGYLIWRFAFTVNWFVWFAIPLFLLEFYNFFNTVFFLITTRKISFPVWKPAKTDQKVDIFIPTYNEPEEIVEMTTIGAKAIRGINKVFILDDGNRLNIKEMAVRHQVEYLARGENSDAKAGNLNYGLQFSDADFIINVDCDHVPQPHIIERLLGYFSNPKLAFIQTPQVFYNQDSIQHKKISFRQLWNEQTMFYESIQPGKNRYNASFFCGSGAMIRRKALDSVGGYATGTATEDIHTSIRLHAKGWKSLFVNENLAFGLAPEDLKEYHKQRVRWGAGSLGLLFRSPDSPLWAKGLTFMQRLCYFNSAMAYMEGTIKLFYFTVPLYVIFFYHELITIDIVGYLAIFVPFLFLSYIVTYFFSRRTYHFPYTELFNIINIFSHLEAIKGIIKIQKKFGVSVKVKRGKQSSLIYPGLWIVAFILVLGNFYGLYEINFAQNREVNSYLIIGMLWNSFNLFFVLFALFYLTSFNSQKREDHKFTVDLLGKLEGFAGDVLIRKMSLHGAMIVSTSPIEKNSNVLSFNLNSELFTIPITLETYHRYKKKYHVYVTFNQLTHEQKVSLTLYFFHHVVPQLFRNDFRYKENSIALPVTQMATFSYAQNN